MCGEYHSIGRILISPLTVMSTPVQQDSRKPSASILEIGKRLWRWISNLLNIHSLWVLLGGSGGATAAATYFNAPTLKAISGTLAGFAAVALVTSRLVHYFELRPYRKHPPETTVELHGGTALTL